VSPSGGRATELVARFVVGATLLVAGCSGGKPSDADCDRAAEHAAKLMDSGFKDQERSIAIELAKLCKDPKQGWSKVQVECVLGAKTSAAFKDCGN